MYVSLSLQSMMDGQLFFGPFFWIVNELLGLDSMRKKKVAILI